MLGRVGKKTVRIARTGAAAAGDAGSGDLPPMDPFFELSLDMLCIAGTDGYFKRINPTFGRVLGYSDEVLLARPFVDFVHPDDVESTIREIRSLDAGQPTVMFENRYLDQAGGIHWIQWNASAPNASGLIYAVARDVTARKRAEENLKRYATELEQSNRQLRATQEQLIQAEKMETVGRLAAGVAHEVKNPLALLLLGVNYLSGGVAPDDPHVPEILEEMTQAITRADRIVRGLVNFSADNQLHLGPVDLRALMADVTLMLRHELNRRGVAVDTRIPADLPPVQGDRGRLEQVMVNLITNALQAMEGVPRPRLGIRARAGELDEVRRDEGARTLDHLRAGDAVVVVEVTDNGAGIAAGDLPKLFDPFFTTKSTGVGTGLGLTVVRRIVDLHRGRIQIGNRPDARGARVTLILKAASAVAPSA